MHHTPEDASQSERETLGILNHINVVFTLKLEQYDQPQTPR